jgi:hypothetical protein
MAQHIVAPIMLERIAVYERLRYGLDGEEVIGFARHIGLAVDRGECHTKGVGVGLAKLGDIVGDLAVAHF